MSDSELGKSTLRTLRKAALPEVETMSPAEIAAQPERTGVSQAVLAAFMNAAVATVSQW